MTRRLLLPMILVGVLGLSPSDLLGQDPTRFASNDPALQAGTSPLNRLALVDFTEVTVSEALATVRDQSGVRLLYSPSLLPSELRVSCSCMESTVRDALVSILSGTGFRFVTIGGQVLIEPAFSRQHIAADGQAAVRSDAVDSSFASTPHVRMLAPTPRARRTGTVVGSITERGTDRPVAAAQVGIVGTGIGALSNQQGRFTLQDVPAGEATVRVSVIGYRSEEAVVEVISGETVTVNFELAQAAVGLEEVVVSVEAGEMRRREMGTDIGTIDVQQSLAQGAVTDMSELLQSRGTGISVTRGSGLAGGGSRIRIRGPSSLTQDNDPLIIIDGVRANHNTTFGTSATAGGGTSRFNDLNPADIQSMQVVKGPAATALYGSEAAPGVIVIETRRGQSGAPQYRFGVRMGTMSNHWSYPDNYTNITQFYGVTNLADSRLEGFRAEQNPLTGDVFLLYNPFEHPNTRPFRRGHTQNYTASVSGGSENVRYYTSADFARQQGVVGPNIYERGTVAANLELAATDALTLGTTFNLIRSERGYPQDNSVGSGMGVNGFLGSPTSSYGENGVCARDALMGVPDGTTGWCTGREGNFGMPFGTILRFNQEGEDVFRTIASANVQWRPRDSFVNRLTVGMDRTERDRFSKWLFDPSGLSQVPLGSITQRRYTDRRFSFEYSGTLSGSLGEEFRRWTTFGAQHFSTLTEWTICQGQEFPNDEVLSCGQGFISSGQSGLQEQKEVGAFLQQRIGFRDYLFTTGAIRVDDNASLGADVGAIWSPSLNASLVLSDMDFWNVDWVDNLRIRTAWGTASQSPAPYAADQTYGSAPVTIGGQLVGGVTPANPGNPELGPERSEEFEIGLDAGFLEESRLALRATYYRIRTRDLIVPREVSPSSGFPGAQMVNLGLMENTGLEIQLDADLVRRPNFTWDMRLSHSRFDPIITELGLDAPIFFPIGADGGSRAAGSQVFQTGFAPGAYVSRVVASAERDAAGNIVSFDLAPGNLGDGSDLRVVGSPWPDGEQSLFTSFTFDGNLTISALVDRVTGMDMLNVTRAFRTPFTTTPGTSAFSREYAFRQVESTPEQQAMIEQQYYGAFIESGDYVKFRELNISYTLPEGWARGLRANSARVTLAGRNLYTWTDFSILDPEMDVQGSRDNFIRNNFAGTFPPMRTFWVGVDLTF